MVYLNVLVNVPAVGNKSFVYSAPEGIALPYGAKVRVSFGRFRADGYVVGEAKKPQDIEVKDILAVYDLRFLPPRRLVNLAERLADYYCVPVATMWSCLWPPVVPKKSISRLKGLLGERPGESEKELNVQSRQGLKNILVWGSKGFRWNYYVDRSKEVFKGGLGVLVLVPEIKRIEYAVRYLKEAFSDFVLIHSELSNATRRAGWLELLSGKKRIAVGTRSAVFAPVKNLGLIIIDEEESDSYKAEDLPRYSAISVAFHRAQVENCRVILGSAHPSVTIYNDVVSGRFELVKEQPASCGTRVKVQTVNILKERKSSRELITPQMMKRLKDDFLLKKRVLLFLNKRGTSSIIMCQDCGNVMMCPRCSVSLSYHATKPDLVCHTCGYRQAVPSRCPVCEGYRWKLIGFGIERAAAEFRKKFPEIPLFRLDHDALKESSVEETLRGFSKSSPSCLLATQMVLGYENFPEIRTVGVLSCDTLLNLPDFRASEKTFQILSGLWEILVRSGTGVDKEFLIQTCNPENHAIRGLTSPEEFYRQELENRKLLNYPPFGNLFKVEFSGKNLEKVRDTAVSFAEKCAIYEELIQVLGPNPSPKAKVRGLYRWQVALKGKDRKFMVSLCKSVLPEIYPTSQVKVSLDLDDPVKMD